LTGWKVDIKGESEAAVSINELFKSEDPDGTEAPVPESSEDGSDQNSQEQALVDAPDSTDAEHQVDTAADAEIKVDADTFEAEMPESLEEKKEVVVDAEENAETLDVDDANDDSDDESE